MSLAYSDDDAELGNAFLKRWVLSCFLKTSTVCGALRWAGRAFHSVGAITEKARLSIVASFHFTSVRRLSPEERRVRSQVFGVRSSLRYGGALP